MQFISKSKFFMRFLPVILTVVLLAGTFGVLWTLKNSKPADAAWYNASWSYRKQITVDHTKVMGGADLSNFPMLISVVDTDLKYTSFGGKVGKTDGTDILITSSDGSTKLSHQIDKYASSTGETVLWVKIPTLSVSTDTVLYIYFGNSGAADQQDVSDGSNDVWDSNYKLIWHLGDGTTLTAPDATSNANTGTVSSATATAGKIGGGGNFSGTSQEITRANTASIGVGAGDSTVSAWIYINAYASAAAVYDKGASGSRDYAFFVTSETSGHIAYGNSGGSGWTGTGFTGGSWHYLTVVQTGGVATVYLDGIQNFTKAVLVQANTSATLSLGGNPSTGGSYWNGKLDEFRVSGATRSVGWIQTEFVNQSDPGSFYAYGKLGVQTVSSLPAASSAAGAAWYNASWAYRRQITIDHTKVATSSSLSNFPMLFSVTDSELKYTSFGGRIGKTDGTDILFTDSSGTKLNHEIEKYSSSTGETIVWVNVPTLSGATDTTLYMYYGNSGAADQQNATSTWDTYFKGAYHLKENPAVAGSGGIIDSTTNANNGTDTGSMDAADQVPAKIGNGLDFDGSNDYVDTNDFTQIEGSAQLTLSAWVKLNTFGDNEAIIADWQHSGNAVYFGLGDTAGVLGTNTGLQARVANANTTGLGWTGTGLLSANQWYYAVMVYDGGGATDADKIKIYINGSPQVLTYTGIIPGTAPNTTSNLQLASRAAGTFLDGIVDEARVAATARTIGWIQTEFNNQSDPASFYAFGPTQTQTRSVAGVKVDPATSAGAAWYNASWTYRRQITVDHTKVATSSSLSNFPMLFSVTDSELKYTSFGGRIGKTDGTDILFTDSSGTKLNHEIEKYSSSTGETIVWVNVPTLSGATDTTLYMYYGNSGAADQQNATSTWETNFKAVWHLKETATSTAAYIADSTSNANNASSTSTSYPLPYAAGKISGAQDFDGSNDQLRAPDQASLDQSSSFTVSAWVNPDSLLTTDTSQWNTIIAKGADGEANGNDHNYILGYNALSSFGTVNRWLFLLENSAGTNCNLIGSSPANFGQWYYVIGVFDDTANLMSLYVNGVLQNTLSCALTPNTNSQPVLLGDDSHTSGLPWDGKIDEARISSIARTNDWLQTEFNNQSDPSSFYSFGSTQTSARSGAGGSGTAPSVKVRGQVKIR